MNANEPNNRASDEVVSAEAELLAAQEALEAARARLAELKSGQSPVDSESAVSEPLPDWVPYSTAPSAASSQAEPVAAPQPVAAPPVGACYSYQQQPPQPQQPQQPYVDYTGSGYDQAPHAGPGAVPPQQPYYGYQYQQPYYQQPYQSMVSSKDHVAAGLLAIFLGQLGIHKFYLGYNTAGFIMLAVTIIGSIFTFGLAAGVMWVIAIIEGILYLTKSQSEFEQTYVINKREWF
ncbi:MAG: TM2 domain-containing protein [Gordonibacter sp.]